MEYLGFLGEAGLAVGLHHGLWSELKSHRAGGAQQTHAIIFVFMSPSGTVTFHELQVAGTQHRPESVMEKRLELRDPGTLRQLTELPALAVSLFSLPLGVARCLRHLASLLHAEEEWRAAPDVNCQFSDPRKSSHPGSHPRKRHQHSAHPKVYNLGLRSRTSATGQACYVAGDTGLTVSWLDREGQCACHG